MTKRYEAAIREVYMKLEGLPIDLDSIHSKLDDIAGIRVICKFIDDIYILAEK